LLKGGLRGWWPEKSSRAGQFVNETQALFRMFSLPDETSFGQLPEPARDLLFQGGTLETGWKVGREKTPQKKPFEGLAHEALRRFQEAKTEITRRRLSRVMAHRPCHVCDGRRLKPEWLAVRIEGEGGRWLGIQDFCALGVSEAIRWLDGFQMEASKLEVCKRLVQDVRKRLAFLEEVGLD
jgi:excinuclease ABC subunit A